ncbi:MAG TPA: hypothetical protein VH300_10795 [Thermoleophilaceae bacterium]|nr:hypothetical protein [Thermoleophilaceae bacterium]
MFGTYPLNISVAPNGAPANGDSSAPAISGDNRKTRLAAFQSDASNLVGGDTNGVTDVFVWFRPKGHQGLSLPRGAGSLQRVSVASDGAQANGPSRSPSLDGSVTKVPHCVAFESDASNLAAGDNDPATDIFVRDLRSQKTVLVSRGVAAPATDPSIAGDCSRVAFVANGQVLVAPVKGGKTTSLGAGSNPDFSLDGRAIAWQQGPNVALIRDGKKSVVGPGENPTVTDAERLHGQKVPSWGVSFDTPVALSGKDSNPGIDTYLRVFGPKGGAKRTDLITYAESKVHFDGSGDNHNGGITAYGTNRGIITFIHSGGTSTDTYYWNQHSGNADDTAHAAALNGQPGISEMVTSARANFIAFSSSFTGDMALPFGSGRGRVLPGVGSVESLFAPVKSVYFKMLVDGEAL